MRRPVPAWSTSNTPSWGLQINHVLAKTGSTVRTHQRRTVANYLRLRDLAPDLPIIPVLQGQSLADYHRCADLYDRHGVDLTGVPLVGVGSVCRRQHTGEVAQIMRSLAVRGLRLHGFGVKITGLGLYRDALNSVDSMAWSFQGRRTPGCSPTHRSEANCLDFALAWHDRVQRTVAPDTSSVKRGEPGDVVWPLADLRRKRADAGAALDERRCAA